jgi:hypothetical protein
MEIKPMRQETNNDRELGTVDPMFHRPPFRCIWNIDEGK